MNHDDCNKCQLLAVIVLEQSQTASKYASINTFDEQIRYPHSIHKLDMICPMFLEGDTIATFIPHFTLLENYNLIYCEVVMIMQGNSTEYVINVYLIVCVSRIQQIGSP